MEQGQEGGEHEGQLSESALSDDRSGSAQPVPDRDRGSVSLAVVLLTPVMVVLLFLGFQAAMWNHARAQIRAVARQTAMMVARDRVPPGQAAAAGRSALAGQLEQAKVSVGRSGPDVVVTVTGRALGVFTGTSTAVRVTVAVPAEGWVTL